MPDCHVYMDVKCGFGRFYILILMPICGVSIKEEAPGRKPVKIFKPNKLPP